MTLTTVKLAELPDGRCCVVLCGDWRLSENLPDTLAIESRLSSAPPVKTLAFECDGISAWDTGLVVAALRIIQQARLNKVEVDRSGLPEGATRLLQLALAVGEREGARRVFSHTGTLARIGEVTLEQFAKFRESLDFVGQLVLSLGRFVRGTATYQRVDLINYIREAGVAALPIVTLISLLIGLIFAFVGIIQLNIFGMGIYTADLVAVAMVREMAPIMTAIVMAGRTGAAYAAQIGTMKVNEEIDALTTLGMNPIDFLVTPRVIALMLMIPLLTLYSSLAGIIGGLLVSLAMLDVSFSQYLQQTIAAVSLSTLFGGLFKSVVYGSLVALAGCQQGVACGNSAMAVGLCTTRAVVNGIVLIVVSAALLTVVYINLGI